MHDNYKSGYFLMKSSDFYRRESNIYMCSFSNGKTDKMVFKKIKTFFAKTDCPYTN